MSTSLTVLTESADQRFTYAGRVPARRSRTGLKVGFIFAVACGAAIPFALRLIDNPPRVAPQQVHVANIKITGLFDDIVEGRLINEGESGEIYVWVEWNGEPGCARHTYLRAGSEYNFSFLCNRMTLSLGGQLLTFASNNPPAWVLRTAASL